MTFTPILKQTLAREVERVERVKATRAAKAQARAARRTSARCRGTSGRSEMPLIRH